MSLNLPPWRQIQKTNFSRIEPLLEFLEMAPEERGKILKKARFPLNLPRRLAAKIAKNTTADPILRQFVPLEEELQVQPGFLLDPVQDRSFQKTQKILHKYQSRALLITTGACAMHCRYCFRQNFPYETQERSFDSELSYIRQNPSLSEVILSGGDPLSLSDSTLSTLLVSLESIPHLKRIRFHTRFPIGIPERIDDSFLQLLKASSKQIFFVIHTNHPSELDPDVFEALRKIRELGIPLLNQSVLLKGVNDDENTFLTLCEGLANQGILPYYLHCLDPVQGAAHFHVSEERGHELIRYVQEHLSGFAVPRLVREEPGKTSKTFLSTSAQQSEDLKSLSPV